MNAAGGGATAPPVEIPSTVPGEGGRDHPIGRAWPLRDGSFAFETSATGGGGVRAGLWTPGGPPTLLAPGEDARLPSLREAARHGTVVSHRPGRRATVRAAGGGEYVKLVRRGRAAAIVQTMRDAHGFSAGLRVPDVVRLSDDSVTTATMPGRTLLDWGRGADPASGPWRRAFLDWADAWPGVVGTAADGGAARLPAHDAASEAAVVRRWVGEALRHGVAVGAEAAALTAAADRVVARLANGEKGPLVLAHRDLHDKQLLWHETGSIAVLDLDTASRSEAALDLGNLLAHLDLRRRQGALAPGACDWARGLVASVADGLGVGAERLADYEAASHLRLGCLYAFRPRWSGLARRMREEAAARRPY